jgi:2Fe-2S ferredoxin
MQLVLFFAPLVCVRVPRATIIDSQGRISLEWRAFSSQDQTMPKVVYITNDGERHEVEVENGYSVMEGAINNNIDGIVAECGGACACATCHSYIDDAWLSKMPEIDDMEDSMLDAAYERKDNSRLTCQIEMSDDLDGLIVHVADNEA